MKKHTELIAFALLIIGTLGLLANETIFDWGSLATLAFAVFNVVGLGILILARCAPGHPFETD